MKIRNYLIVMALAFFSFASISPAMAKENMTREQAEARASQIKERVDEIKSIDLTTLNKTERVQLRHELKDMKTEMRQSPVLIVISGGALLLIIILLIILL